MNVLELAQQQVQLKQACASKGGEWAGPCPKCGGKDRFRVWPAQNEGAGSWWCRGCNEGGDGIAYLRRIEGLSFGAAAAKLGVCVNKTVGRCPIPPTSKGGAKPMTSRGEGSRAQSELWQQKAEAFVLWSQEKLEGNERAMAFLKSRGISRATARRHRLGWNPGDNQKDIFRPRESWGLPEKIKEDEKAAKLWLPRGLVIPRIGGNGQVTRLRIRRPEGEPRYYVVPGSCMEYWAAPGPSRAVLVVESELDGVLMASIAGDLVTVLAIGSAQEQPDGVADEILRRASVVLVALDADSAGSKAAKRWYVTYKTTKRWPVPDGKDPGEAFAAGEDLRQWVVAGLPKGWRVGPLVGASHCKGGGGEAEEQVVSEDVAKLQALLARHPVVSIVWTDNRTRLLAPERWRADHWEGDYDKLSKLVFFSDDVANYVARGGDLGGRILRRDCGAE